MYEDRAQLCPHFEQCGGCTMQKISYGKQLEIKAAQVRNLLEEAELQIPDFEGILGSPSEEGYRNKMEFTFGDECKGGPFALGLHMRGSFMNIVNLTDCHLVHPDMNLIRNKVRDFLDFYYSQGLISFRNNKTQIGYLRHLLIRRAAATGEILVALVTTSQYPEALKEKIPESRLMEQFVDVLKSLEPEGEITGILHIVNDARSDVVQSDRTEILSGRDYIYEEVLGLRFKVSVFSFFQTNTKGAELLYRKAREYAADAHGTLFDLYCGTGTISQLMSPAVEKVIGVEIVPEAVEAARENAKLNGISNAEFIADDVLKALEYLPVPDSLILDPPREGIHPKALGMILRYGIENIVYVSCKPASLARDLHAFDLAGYRIRKVCCVDMFPQTNHIETIVLLQRQNS